MKGYALAACLVLVPAAQADECANLRHRLDLETTVGGGELTDRNALRDAFNAAMAVTESDPRALPSAFAVYRAMAEARRSVDREPSADNLAVFAHTLLAAYEVAYLANCVLGTRVIPK